MYLSAFFLEDVIYVNGDVFTVATVKHLTPLFIPV
jgi:hypothetical protein